MMTVVLRFLLFLAAIDVVCAAPSDPSSEFFKSSRVPHIRIEIANTNLDSLRKDARRYVPATLRDGNTVYTDVAVRLKGAAGSFRPIDDRPALTLNFDKYTPDQKYHGLEKMHL